jgi:hypothetical protein
MPRNSGSIRRYTRVAKSRGFPTESATENQTAPLRPKGSGGVRVKRWSKSPPLARESDEARKTPSGARPNRGPRSCPLHVPQPRNGSRVLAAETNDSLPAALRSGGKTKFGLQPFQNHPTDSAQSFGSDVASRDSVSMRSRTRHANHARAKGRTLL